ncbi:MAG: restriction endonuclease [Methylobacter sp.]|uniref:restriction endonuclease n=1 Tax=Methylobacter sp. TaxID=2051955 RepID=UPI00272F6B75|nr:restriction endonuclease [Methylobacter sp.]MDP1665018.1 restriction endonuclease [Methylobacter sp.]MDP1971234.1 restriction endonuclease [Methylobacter sp.]
MRRIAGANPPYNVDIIANKDGIKLALQCKYYSSPVGNKAVQEIFASLSFYGPDYGAVISNSTYTKAAQALANSAGIKLLHHSDAIQF